MDVSFHECSFDAVRTGRCPPVVAAVIEA